MSLAPSLPRVTLMRQAAVAVLKAGGTFAGSNVFDTRLDALSEEKDYPAIVVSSSADRDILSRAGGIPVFNVTYNLMIGAGFVDADAAAAVQGVDQLAQQVLDALLCDPKFLPAWMGQIASITEKKTGGRGEKTARYVSIVEITLTSKPIPAGECYPPNTQSVLDINGMPLATRRDVIAPLTSITETVKLPSGDIALSTSKTFTVP